MPRPLKRHSGYGVGAARRSFSAARQRSIGADSSGLNTFMLLISALIFGPMVLEAVRAAHNERAQRARGGVEPIADVYRWMRIAYPAAFAAMLVEGALRGAPSGVPAAVGLVTFLISKAIKWTAIQALGTCWTFRVIVVPGQPLVTKGPYRLMRHPNYVAVVGELVGTALMTRAFVSGPLGIAGFGLLMLKRIAVEEQALARTTAHADAILRAK
jgi:methyltransferase